jgi:exodeoxyribonuclease-3
LDKEAIETILHAQLPGWKGFEWSFATKSGYSGTAILSKDKPLRVIKSIESGNEEFDTEGRIVAGEYNNFWLVNSYSPNSGQKLDRLAERTNVWDVKLSAFCKELERQGKPVLLTGDLNCAHKEIDIHSPKTNLKSAGFTIEERTSFGKNFINECGMVDSFRAQYPGQVVGYTYFSHRSDARATNKGWRLDYWLVSSSLADKCHDTYILKETEGSDHVPLGLVLLH